MEENEGKNLAAEEKILEVKRIILEEVSKINEEKSRVICGNVVMNVEKRDDKFECFIGGYKIITVKDRDVRFNIQELERLYEEIKETNDEDRPTPDLLESMGLPELDNLKDYEERKQNEQQREKNGNNAEPKEKEQTEKEEPEKEKDEDIKDKPENEKKAGLLELNLGVLKLINPKLRECTKAYLDPNTNSLIFKDRFGKKHAPEEYGFTELKTSTGNFELTKMHENGEVTSHENPTKVYAIKGSNFGISTDFGTHHREANLIVRDREHGHENSYSVIKGNLAKFDSGDISTYRKSWDIGIREGIFKSGDRDATNEKAKEILDNASNETRENLQKGFAEQGHTINDEGDLKRVIADILENEYKEEPEEAMEIATEIVDTGKMYEEIKAERENSKRQEASKDTKKIDKDEGFGLWDSARNSRPR